ncbi:type II secretion system protein N [Novosphingobium sp. MMS21-SN21R]|uniref:type II secretion system protein N n=1 Tax=Novosphingobium sp. MMS21-SN21R TaxID=2969298 RepID=UPI0028850C66|nr:type II secretion system protein N [Novosphingobium sp. MMS21-SN21R]MDT0508971.1 type II secretion system protein N [Novosphingobium sp. MMS21-SN21R]
MIGRWIFVRERALTRRGWLALAVLTAAALLVLLPLRLVLGWAASDNVTARSAKGSVWSGRIADLQVGPLPLGTLDARLDPLPLLLGRAQFAVSRAGDAPFSAKASLGGGDVRLSGANGAVTLPGGLDGLPVTAISFGDFSARIEDGACADAEGTLGVTLASVGPLLPDTVTLSGKARCDKGALLVPMQGPGGMERLTLRIAGDGAWKADLILSGLPPEVSGPLLQGGFTARPGGVGLRTSGKF